MLKWLKRAGAARNEAPPAEVWRHLDSQGLLLGTFESVGAIPGATPLASPMMPAMITQLHDEGYAVAEEASARVSWESLYNLLDDPAYAKSLELLELPPACDYIPELKSHGSLTSPDFSIGVTRWRDGSGRVLDSATRTGALMHVAGQSHLLSHRVWDTVEQVARFHNRPESERDEESQRMRWGQIRRTAMAAKARMDEFLYKSVVLTPDTIDIHLRKTEVGGTKVVEIMPGFEGAPENWLEVFDSYRNTVPLRYDVNTDKGIVQVLITPEVRTVLDNIRRLPGRLVAGSRAEAFLLNPFATLGEDASAVIDEAQFERARVEADIFFDHFTALIERDALGFPEKVALAIEMPGPTQVSAEERFFAEDTELEDFIRGAERALASDKQLYGWQGYDFELLGDSAAQVELLKAALAERQQPRILVRYEDVYDLSAYTSRVNDIGIEQPYYSPYIAKKGEEWCPENLVNVIVYTPEDSTEPVAVPVTDAVRDELQAKVEQAQAVGQSSVELPGFPKPLPVTEARDILDAFEQFSKSVRDGHDKLPKSRDEKEGRDARPKAKQLLIKPNVNAVDYEEIRHDILTTFSPVPVLPSGFLPTTQLLPHQDAGVAWLQHLFRHAPNHCRGAVVADDMGLGKTLQLLTFMARAFEDDPTLPPALVVAPVSLLENWAEEIGKFFKPGTFRPLIAYGDNLSSLRVPRAAIDEELRSENLIRFLRPDWVGDANIVLTTYETLRDLEFSFAAQKWSVMACDEAQKIKNPNAMVTRAAKKQNVMFKIACTGTPVENTLVDLWCLFDLVQAGYLGALNEFGKRYRKPIEAETDEEKARVEELRRLIEPQILRRMKTDVASLPPKHLVPAFVLISNLQRSYYTNAVNAFRASKDPDSKETIVSPFKNHLGLLQYLRSICTMPHAPGMGRFKPKALEQARNEAPKLAWLIDTLEQIRAKGEKAIVFAEFRETQQMLAHYTKEVFGFSPDIINGDVTAAAKHIASRQKRIKAFQAKPGFGVIILSPVAVGFGVNVQEANHVIHYTRNWNPAKEDQATDRAYRIGQKREVWVYLPILSASDFTTFEVRLNELLEAKRKLASDMLNGTGTVLPSDWNLQDIIPGGANDAVFSRALTLDDVLRMEWDYFEALVAAIWQKKGFRTVYRTPSQDEGVDVVAFTGNTGDLIQCKSSGTEDAALDSQGVKDVVSGEAEYRLRHPGVNFSKWVATNQYFNETAVGRAHKNRVTLVNQKDFESLLRLHPVTHGDVQRFLLANWDDAHSVHDRNSV
ncbi:ATP-dependent helicase protein [Burkholderia pseudomallei]|uniref:SNF2-related protein n=1 Tax=Burkholderia pseudomallei TaxID=28450 RepID=UPI000F07B22B|nr:SNF2-related protein [Burkholderia pseudomallei]CAJ7234983.1 ATP-dependent helicase protein [Burkholderia pseudomallei]VBC15591.1 ATP-dependent helicase protein [Burkholderia pseudomallei]VBS98899.1 ATP-dependent helicase protein [Burkholderia pseudomallei]